MHWFSCCWNRLFHSCVETRSFGFLLVAYIFKDCVFLDASIGKKVFKLRIVGEDGGRPSLKRVVLRNVPSLIFIGLEALQVKNGEQRLGDSLAETKIVFENREIT
jgi:uncharacterized RDD family membrane protein YckC